MLWAYLALAVTLQAIIGARVLGSDSGHIAYPLTSILGGLLYWQLPARILGAGPNAQVSDERSSAIVLTTGIGVVAWVAFLAYPAPILPFVGWLGDWQNVALAAILALICTLAFGRNPRELMPGGARIWALIATILAVYTAAAIAMGRDLGEAADAVRENLVVAALPEEVVFRFLLLGGLLGLPKLKRTHAILIAGLAFGLFHLPINIRNMGVPVGIAFCICGNGFGGVLFGHLYERTRSLPALVVLHTVINALVGA